MMTFLSRFFRSDKKLSRPDFSSAHIEVFDFSGNTIEVRDPPQSAMIPLEKSTTKLDIYSWEPKYAQPSGDYIVKCYTRGWDFWGKGSKPLGGVLVDMFVNYFPQNKHEGKNFFNEVDQSIPLLLEWHELWGHQAGSTHLGVLGDDTSFKYPTNVDELYRIKTEQTVWLKSSGCYKNDPPTLRYTIPLTASHCLIVVFSVHAYRGVDFHSPATNLKETAMAVIDDFMDNIKITYSEQSLKDMQAAKSASQ